MAGGELDRLVMALFRGPKAADTTRSEGVNRIDALASLIDRLGIVGKPKSKVDTVTREEFAIYQDWQSQAFARGDLTQAEANTLFLLFGGATAAGWPPNAGYAKKAAALLVMREVAPAHVKAEVGT